MKPKLTLEEPRAYDPGHYNMDDVRRAFIPAESPSHKRKAKAGRARAQQEDRGRLVGKLPKEKL